MQENKTFVALLFSISNLS